METTKKPSVKKVLSIVGNTVLWLFVAFAIVITVIVFASNNNKSEDNSLSSIGGLAIVTISSDSMSRSPKEEDYQSGGRLEGKTGFKKGALIFVNKLTDAEKEKLAVGDVITFRVDLDHDGKEEFNTHRIIDVHEHEGKLYFVTQGDHNEFADGVYSESNSAHASSGYVVTASKIEGKWNGRKIAGVGKFLAFLQTRTGFFVVIILPLIAFFLYELIRFVLVILSLRGKKTEDEIRQKVMEELLRAQQAGQPAAPETKATQTDAPAEKPAEEPKEPKE